MSKHETKQSNTPTKGADAPAENRTPLPAFQSEVENLHRELDRMIGNFWGRGRRFLNDFNAGDWNLPNWPAQSLPANLSGMLSMAVDESEDEKAYHVSVELPGMDEKDIKVELHDGVLTISGEKKTESETSEKDFHRRERSFGSFKRSISVPVEVVEEKVEATFDKGVLHVVMPKSADAKQKSRRIQVRGK